MNRRFHIRRFGCLLVALLASVQAGCAGPDADENPEKVLSVASAGLEGVDRYTFRIRSFVRSGGIELQELESCEGEIAGHAVRAIRSLSGGSARAAAAVETPASRLAALARERARVEFADRDARRLMLRVTLEGDAAVRQVRERLVKRFERAAERAASERSLRAGADAGAAERYRAAVSRETERFRRELAGLLDGLEAEMTVLVTIDRRTMLPLELEETTVLRYEAGGRKRTEEQVTRMTLDGFNGRPS
ncbi:MAG: hypothetical protein A9Z00_13670 [Thermobacillus sp. ZCTH02-B1]|uniref:hypothetical protein n=1 Tax=Thermobacillus sp. ZCTH02-B1 TaxID=1858795 RepID=UPI000B57D189|nr:hypothetical protein [Thermobacillus sp. ZCTH02-B1]OUM96461.1 MAG: hypothetical protein A9Z00_13670 [Thermobacillus sp. ZCTH02-B1]